MAATGYTPISIYYSSTTTNVPTAGNLVAGELAINTADGKLFYKDSSGVVQVIGTKGGVGSSTTTQVLYNNAGTVAGSANLIFNGTNLGLGITPNASWSSFSAIQLGGNTYNAIASSNSYMAVYANTYYDGTNFKYVSTAGASTYTQNGGAHYWSVASSGTAGNNITFTQAMVIDASGNLLVGTSTGTTNGGYYFAVGSSSSFDTGHATGTASGATFQRYTYASSVIGSITQTGTTAVLYNTTSDYRLKNDVTPIQNALATVEALNPVSFTWVDGRKDDGFIAHELQTILPNCVTGEKDAMNEDGTPKYQQMDNSGVIPFLVKAIQELNAKVDALEAQLLQPK